MIHLLSWLYLKLNDAQAVAESRELTVSTIYTHLSTAIKHEVIALEDIIEINEADIKQIEQAIELCAEGGQEGTKAVFDFLNEEIAYGIIHCVRARLDTIV